jgi:hypothetical protein
MSWSSIGEPPWSRRDAGEMETLRLPETSLNSFLEPGDFALQILQRKTFRRDAPL